MKIMRNVVLAIGAFFFVLYLMTPYSVFGASFDHTVLVTDDPTWDSAFVYVIQDGDTTRYIISQDTTFVLNDTSAWKVIKGDYWNGTGYSYPDYPPAIFARNHIYDSLIFQGSASSLTAAAIASEVNDTVTAQHGSGAYTTGSVSGTGSDTLNFYAIDTSGTDIGVERAKITVLNASGAFVVSGYTGGSGNKTLYIDPGTYTILATQLGYSFNSLAYTVAGNSDSVQVSGYDLTTTISTPSDSSLCNVYGSVLDRGNGVYGATVTLTLPNHAYDSCNNSILVKKVFKDYTDSDGLFSLYVPKSGCLNRNKNGSLMKYTVNIKYKNEKTKKSEFSIPSDSSTYYLVF